MEKVISDSEKHRVNMDKNLDEQKTQIDSRIDCLMQKYPAYKAVIEEWREKYGQK